jgi:hypothetical protein
MLPSLREARLAALALLYVLLLSNGDVSKLTVDRPAQFKYTRLAYFYNGG